MATDTTTTTSHKERSSKALLGYLNSTTTESLRYKEQSKVPNKHTHTHTPNWELLGHPTTKAAWICTAQQQQSLSLNKP